MNQLIINAINNKKIISFEYNVKLRIGEPQVYGICGGKEQLLIWQIGGDSNSGNSENWRMCELKKIKDFVVLEENFNGARGAGFNTKFTTTFAVVR